MQITFITKQGARLNLNLKGVGAVATAFWVERAHQLYQGKAVAGYFIKP